MLFALLKSYATWLVVSILICGFGVLLTLFYDVSQTRLFLLSYVYYWNGLLVLPAAYGALHFAQSTFNQHFHLLAFSILETDDETKVTITSRLDRLFSFRNKQTIALAVFVIGGAIMYICGYPLSGLPQYYLWVVSSAMFYAGGLMLAYGLYIMQFFHVLETNIENIDLQDNVNIVELENFSMYLSLLFLTAIIALYLAFRGTLTANFTFMPPHPWVDATVRLFIAPGADYSSVRNLLVYPIVIFLPLSLIASFYMKLVLRRIYLISVKRKVSEIDQLAKPIIEGADAKSSELAVLEVRKAVFELKEKVVNNNNVLPLVSIKDSPSILLVAVVILQFIWINDAEIHQFFDGLLGITN